MGDADFVKADERYVDDHKLARRALKILIRREEIERLSALCERVGGHYWKDTTGSWETESRRCVVCGRKEKRPTYGGDFEVQT